MTIEEKLEKMGLTLPPAPGPRTLKHDLRFSYVLL